MSKRAPYGSGGDYAEVDGGKEGTSNEVSQKEDGAIDVTDNAEEGKYGRRFARTVVVVVS